MPRRFYLIIFIGSVGTLEIEEEFLIRVSEDYPAVKWIVHKISHADFKPIEKVIN